MRCHPPTVLVLLAALAVLVGGCAVPTRFERGEHLRTERRFVQSEPEYRLQSLEQLDAEPPKLIVWVDVREWTSEETRGVYQKVRVEGTRGLALEPSSFLWPWNVVRTPVGLTGLAFSGLVCGGHYVAAGAGAVAGIAGTVIAWPYVRLGQRTGLVTVRDPDARSTTGTFAQVMIGLFETPLLIVDLPHKLVHGTPIYPVFRNLPSFPDRWLGAMDDSWQFATDWQAYPPFFVWARTSESRSVVPGETLKGGWTPRRTPGEWDLAPMDRLRLTGDGWSEVRRSPGAMAEIDLRSLAAARARGGTLRFAVEVSVSTGPLRRDFSYEVTELRR
ncbi:MAG: hypothetical protein R6X33_18915 [Candidatus Brocadiia bacterium]